MIGLKENVIIGKLIPAGTGMNRYRSLETSTSEDIERILEEERIAKEKAEAEKAEAEQEEKDAKSSFK